MINLIAKCRICKEDKILEVSEKQYGEYENGALIQNAFPHLSAGDRELLISGTCEPCFIKIFGEEE